MSFRTVEDVLQALHYWLKRIEVSHLSDFEFEKFRWDGNNCQAGLNEIRGADGSSNTNSSGDSSSTSS